MLGQEPFTLDPGYYAPYEPPPAASAPAAAPKASAWTGFLSKLGGSLAAGLNAAVDMAVISANRELANSLDTTSPFEKKAAVSAGGMPGWAIPAAIAGTLGIGLIAFVAMKK